MCVCVCVCVCIYIYIYIYINNWGKHTHIQRNDGINLLCCTLRKGTTNFVNTDIWVQVYGGNKNNLCLSPKPFCSELGRLVTRDDFINFSHKEKFRYSKNNTGHARTRNIKVRSCNNWCHGKALSITYSRVCLWP